MSLKSIINQDLQKLFLLILLKNIEIQTIYDKKFNNNSYNPMKYFQNILYVVIGMATACNAFASTTYLDCWLEGRYFLVGKKPFEGVYLPKQVSLEINDNDKYLEFKTIDDDYNADSNMKCNA